MGKIIPMPKGTKYGHLTIIDDTPIKKNNRYHYLCKCDCGKEQLVCGIDLRSGHSKSCGCTKGEKIATDMKGQRFGKLVVLERDGSNSQRLAKWKCQCDCGNICSVAGSSLRSGYTTSCGCYQLEKISERKYNLIGQKFGKLLVLKEGRTTSNIAGWLCQCECGNQLILSTSVLVNNITKSCGCVKSKGEYLINQILSKNNIKYQTQYHIYYDNSDKYFDFAVLDENNTLQYLIEYDGIQHFEEKSGWNEPLENIQYRDKIKNQWCKENNIPLIRIPYTHLNELKLQDLILNTSAYIVI